MDVLQRNNVKVGGIDGPVLLFAHGYGCDQNMWRWVTPAFEDRYRTITFDHVGAGGSDLSAFSKSRYATLDGYAADVIEVAEASRSSRTCSITRLAPSSRRRRTAASCVRTTC